MTLETTMEMINFDLDAAGTAPSGWVCGVTGKGAPRWSVEADAGAVSPPNVLKQSGAGDFPWCVRKGASIADGFVEVRFKALAGKQDQAGGVVWRWKDGNNSTSPAPMPSRTTCRSTTENGSRG